MQLQVILPRPRSGKGKPRGPIRVCQGIILGPTLPQLLTNAFSRILCVMPRVFRGTNERVRAQAIAAATISKIRTI